MKRVMQAAFGALLLATAAGASAQVYKWVDAKGVTHYSDQPPPPEVKNAQVKNLDGGAAGNADLPYEVALAMRNAPVTLFTTTACDACDHARTLLQKRGVPYTEKTISSADDGDALRAAGGNGDLPFILVGSTRLTGFAASTLNATLTAAGYPAQRMLAPNYKFASAAPAAPPKGPSPEEVARAAAEAAAKAKAEEEKRAKLPPKPAFQF